MAMSTGAPPSRRERLREQTSQEIKDTARKQLVTRSAAGLSLRAIAREMGMSAPAIYRYFANRDELITALIVDCYGELTEALEAARDRWPASDLGAQLFAASAAYRSWAIEHPAEFGLVFGTPVPGYVPPPDGPTTAAGKRFGRVFLDLFIAIWQAAPYRLPARQFESPQLIAELEGYAGVTQSPLPAGGIHLFFSAWARLHGLITLEAFGHLPMTRVRDLYFAELFEIGQQMGLAPSDTLLASLPLELGGR